MSCALRIRRQALEEGLQQGMEQGLQQGLRQGLRQGREEGVQHGQCELLRKQLAERFGAPLPANFERRLRDASRHDLERWSLALLRAADLEAVFAD